jgi:hypothetical protein
MKTDPKEKKSDEETEEIEKKKVDKEPEQPEYDDTVDYTNDDDTDIDKEEYFEK